MAREKLKFENEEQLAKWAASWILQQETPKIFLLYGQLGAGKTSFTKHCIKALSPHINVSSPTFNIIHEYASEPFCYHIDLYRLERDEVEELGLEEIFEQDNCFCFIEWPDRLGGMKLPKAISLEFAFLAESQNARILTVGDVDEIMS